MKIVLDLESFCPYTSDTIVYFNPVPVQYQSIVSCTSVNPVSVFTNPVDSSDY